LLIQFGTYITFLGILFLLIFSNEIRIYTLLILLQRNSQLRLGCGNIIFPGIKYMFFLLFWLAGDGHTLDI